MRLLVCAGGTGGGVYPALAVLQALMRRIESDSILEIMWVGGVGGMEENLIRKAGFTFEAIHAAGLHGVDWRALPANLWKLWLGYWQSRRILKRFHPDVLLFTGGYVAVPVALAGRRIATLLYVPDIQPGLALKTLSRFADRIAVSAEDTREYFPGNHQVIVTGYPTRTGLQEWTKEAARQTLDLEAGLPVLLVFGGSKGARSINHALISNISKLVEEMQVVHITGQLDWEEVETVRQNLPVEVAGRYRTFAYLHHEMGAALRAADLVVSRAGASCLGEFPLFGLPAILVPYPHAWRYQKINANYLARHQAACILADELLETELLPLVLELMRNPARRKEMSQAMFRLASPEAARKIADCLVELASLPVGG